MVASESEPFIGWTDSLTGPVGLSVAVGSGLLHSILIDTKYKADLIPVDHVCNRLIAIPWAESKKSRMFVAYCVTSISPVAD